MSENSIIDPSTVRIREPAQRRPRQQPRGLGRRRGEGRRRRRPRRRPGTGLAASAAISTQIRVRRHAARMEAGEEQQIHRPSSACGRSSVLLYDYGHWMGQKQNAQNFCHEQMKDGVHKQFML